MGDDEVFVMALVPEMEEVMLPVRHHRRPITLTDSIPSRQKIEALPEEGMTVPKHIILRVILL